MESKNKNILIGGLLAIVLVMAVGYAAFATQLNINGTAEITSRWDVRYEMPTGATSGTTCTVSTTTSNCGIAVEGGVISQPGEATVRGDVPTGSITYSNNDLTATITAELKQPGDKVTYTLTPHNYGTLPAVAGDPVVTVIGGDTTTAAQAALGTATAETWSGNSVTVTAGKIKYTVSFDGGSSVAAGQDDSVITVVAEYDSVAANATVGAQAAAISVTLTYTQAS